MRRFVPQTLLVLLAVFAAMAHGQDDREARRKLALEVPIADMHMHLHMMMSPDDLLARMDRNNVRWGGGVGPIAPGVSVDRFIQLLGKRYVPAGAQPELMAIYTRGGTTEMVDAQSASFQALQASVQQAFEEKKIQGVGELILNNRYSHPSPPFRRKVPIDAPTFKALFELADKHGGFVQIHMEDDGDSIDGLEALLKQHAKVPVVLSHCMARAGARSARALLRKHANLYCELSARSSALLVAPFLHQYRIHDAERTDSSWVALLEELPDRFMLGSDDTGFGASYDNIISTMRTGLLPHLSESTLKKVAYENAQRVFKLEP